MNPAHRRSKKSQGPSVKSISWLATTGLAGWDCGLSGENQCVVLPAMSAVYLTTIASSRLSRDALAFT
jgi:hypothetical protein